MQPVTEIIIRPMLITGIVRMLNQFLAEDWYLQEINVRTKGV